MENTKTGADPSVCPRGLAVPSQNTGRRGEGGENTTPQGLLSSLLPVWPCRGSALSDCGLTDPLLAVLVDEPLLGTAFPVLMATWVTGVIMLVAEWRLALCPVLCVEGLTACLWRRRDAGGLVSFEDRGIKGRPDSSSGAFISVREAGVWAVVQQWP